MSMSVVTEGAPRWASAPGDTIRRVLSSRGLSEEDLADALAMSDPDARRLLNGERAITDDLAQPLSALLGSTPSFWMTREQQYRESLTWLEADDLVLRTPVSEMVEGGWIGAVDNWKAQAKVLLDFYGVGDVSEWRSVWGPRLTHTHYRESAAFESSDMAIAAWLRQVDVKAEDMKVAPWSSSRLRAVLPELRALTKVPDPGRSVPLMQALLASAGVAVVLLPAIQGNRLSGAASVLSDGRRVIGLTGRHLAEDHLWFTVFHEIGHLLLHSREENFLDVFEDEEESAAEVEANAFARKTLLPHGTEDLISLRAIGPTKRQVIAFASAAGVSPGIVVGQLHHQGALRYNQLRNLIRSYHWDGSTLKI